MRKTNNGSPGFLDVDVFRTEFGIVSEKAIYSVFQKTFNIPMREMYKYKFQECVKRLRDFKQPGWNKGGLKNNSTIKIISN